MRIRILKSKMEGDAENFGVSLWFHTHRHTDAGQQTRGRKGSEQKDLRKEDSKHLPWKIPERHEWGQMKGKGQSLKGS